MADFLQKLQTGLLGAPQSYGGLLSADEQKESQRQAMIQIGLQLMAAGGPSSQPVGLGQAIGGAVQAGRQTQNANIEQSLNAALLKAQIERSQQKSQPASPAAVQEYEYAKQNGFEGSFQDWKRVASAQQTAPAGIQEYEYFTKLTPEAQKQFMALQRSPVVPQVVNLAGGQALVDRTGTEPPKYLTTLQQETEAAAQLARSKATGEATGQAEGALAKKSINAMNILETLDLAEPLIEASTGSATGAAADKIAAFFGKSLEGDQAIAQLKIVQAHLMTNMPRMEGPQSDRDVQLYREAAGELGDPTVPRGRKKAALTMIRSLQEKYAEGAMPAAGGAGNSNIDALLEKYAPKK